MLLVILFLALISLIGAVVIVTFLNEHPDLSTAFEEPLATLILAAILFVPQVVLLAGAPGLPRVRPQRRRSMIVSMTSASLLAGALSFGLVASFLSLADKWNEVGDAIYQRLGDLWWLVLLLPWGFWFVVFAFVWAGQWVAIFRRIYRLLVAGTVLELIVTIPIDVKIRKQTSCYCGEGTFFGLSIGIAAAFCTFGPGMAMLYLARYTQRMKKLPFCAECGYDLQGLPENRCPECGTAFDPAQFDAAMVKQP